MLVPIILGPNFCITQHFSSRNLRRVAFLAVNFQATLLFPALFFGRARMSLEAALALVVWSPERKEERARARHLFRNHGGRHDQTQKVHKKIFFLDRPIGVRRPRSFV